MFHVPAHFTVCNLLGRGSYGSVYFVRDTRNNNSVAIKMIPKSKQTLYQLNREIEVLRRLNEKNYPYHSKFYEYFDRTAVNMYYIVMEYFPGIPITDINKNIVLPNNYDLFSRILIQILQALRLLDENSIAHRDIKGENILINLKEQEPNIKLIDFGLSKIIQYDEKGNVIFENKGEFATGSPIYAAPELYLEKEIQNLHKCDIYSLGSMFYIYFTERYPYPVDTHGGLLRIIKTFVPQVNTGHIYLDTLIGMMLEKKPENRKNAIELLDYLL